MRVKLLKAKIKEKILEIASGEKEIIFKKK